MKLMSGTRKRNQWMSRWPEEVCCSLELGEGTRSGNLSTRVRNTPFVQPNPSWNISAVRRKNNEQGYGVMRIPFFSPSMFRHKSSNKKMKNIFFKLLNKKHLSTSRIKCLVKNPYILPQTYYHSLIKTYLLHTAWNALENKTNSRVQWFWHFFINSIRFICFWFGLEILRLVYQNVFFK